MSENMNFEEKRKLYEKRYGKPVFFVHELIYCSRFRNGAPENIVTEKIEIGQKVHRAIQGFFIRRFDYYEAEKELVLERENYVLVGHADLVNHRDKEIIEIKPHIGRDVRHIYQLSAYVAMYNTIYKMRYYGAFIVYHYDRERNTVRWSKIRPLYLIEYMVDVLDKVAEKILKAKERRIATMMCNQCIFRDVCKPVVKIVHNNGFIRVE